MLNTIIKSFKYGKHTITLETGFIACQATSSVMITMDDTTILVTMVVSKKKTFDQKFFPLTINYQERAYAVGRIPGGFFRREGRSSENEILISRLIDRPIRPLFPKNFCHEVQIVATVVSVNPQINPDIVSIIGASTVLKLSGIPLKGPIGAARVGYINHEYVLNPTIDDMKNTQLDLIVSGTKNTILMVEASVKLLNEDQVLNAILFGHQKQQVLIDNINRFIQSVGVANWKYICYDICDHELFKHIFQISYRSISKIYQIISTSHRNKKLKVVQNNIIKILKNENPLLEKFVITNMLNNIEKIVVRKNILKSGIRIDGRKKNEIRSLNARINVLPRTHGSALFTRGDTQSLVSVTLGTSRDAQNLDELLGDKVDSFLFHYNFPPYSTGDIGIVGSPKRREIGHGRLAKRSLLAVMPTVDHFPYTIRIVSEITGSNGSSSMASVCGASLALMSAGVPITSAISGISMGLIKEKEKYIILSDILGEEDHFGDMDFKISGSKDGITAIQMDIKIPGITSLMLKHVLYQSTKSRLYILDIMNQTIRIHNNTISQFAPCICTMRINPDKIKDVIGKGGSVIRMITEETGTIIEIKDDGIVKIAASLKQKAINAINRIKEITADIIVGKIYNGKVIKITNFGAFVAIGVGKEGLVHISQISHKKVEKINDYLKITQNVFVKVLEIDRQGRMRLSIKQALNCKT
ncbi:polyribonucleotide nucleotidyltransferase [Buchnera aphidicola]|uniref:Polyribonucleotide nucleotidyltransferase n=1 Tax=Buchnera aphidicola (Stegophylla sp.) TaxID=2315800 RepID=A0A4D6YL86_9GAMM|nr:polyribonucleotide nucleotidyltransferase [Buchnera aphidicola (Stegophylla sp.)]QCI26398.1 polyribonucleotide nucleotidyltransferase [Buchnera aphidicola (Stegophylla sp.)]